MRNYHPLLLVAIASLSFSTNAQDQKLLTSSIETIVGDEATSIQGADFSLGGVSGLAVDSDGNTYFSIQAMSRVYRLGPDGQVTVYAGNGVDGKIHEGEPATKSPLDGPYSLAVDSTGNLYISSMSALLRVDARSGFLSTVFKVPYAPTASAIPVRGIDRMAFGPEGDLYFIEGGDFRIKRYSFDSGVVTILAGNGTLGDTRTGVRATSTPLKYPRTVAVDSEGIVYFSGQEATVFRIRPTDGILESVSIRLPQLQSPLGEFDIPSDIALDNRGHLFVAQANRSQVLTVGLKSGDVSVYAGTGSQKFNGDGISATKATVLCPGYVATDPDGNLIIAEIGRIRSVDASSRLITTVVGNGLPVADDTRASALRAKLWEPAYAFPAADGSLYITSSFSARVLRLSQGGELTTVAGGGEYVSQGEEPGPASQVALYAPQGMWMDSDGDLYFTDFDNGIVRHLDNRTNSVSNFAKTPKDSTSGSEILQAAAGLVADGNYFYMSDPHDHRVWRISRRDGEVESFVGIGKPARAPDGMEASPILDEPSGLAIDSAGNLYIADGDYGEKGGRILRVEAGTRTLTTILSNLRRPSGLAFQTAHVLCFSENAGNQVRCLDLEKHTVKVIVGTGVAGYFGDGGPAECAQLNRPSGISFDESGLLYIADTGNQRIRRVHLGKNSARCAE